MTQYEDKSRKSYTFTAERESSNEQHNPSEEAAFPDTPQIKYFKKLVT
jgi:hypothetical protein